MSEISGLFRNVKMGASRVYLYQIFLTFGPVYSLLLMINFCFR